MAQTDLLSQRSLVLISIFICIFVDLLGAEDVAYTLQGFPSNSESVIVLDGHGIYKRAVDPADSNTTDTNEASQAITTAVPMVTNPTSNQPTTQGATTGVPEAQNPTTQATSQTTYTIIEKEDNHKYYTSQILNSQTAFDLHWIEQANAVKHKTLSDNYRVAVSIPMKFKFRFYGHEINSVTIATGGFLYMSPFLHKWLTATQYIAPLMANFDTNLGNGSEILYQDYGHMFIVEWSNIYLQDQNHTNPFLFQTQLLENGTIKFIYKQMPLLVKGIQNKNHPVKIGLSDAYYIDSSSNVTGQRNGSEQKYSDSHEGKSRRTIYEYHRVEVNQSRIQEGTVVILQPRRTCNLLTDCNTCVTESLDFNCKWCGVVKRCSDGVDWKRQTWRDKGCITLAHDNVTMCIVNSTAGTSVSPMTTNNLVTATTTVATTNMASVTTTTLPTTLTDTTSDVSESTSNMSVHSAGRACGGAGKGNCAYLNRSNDKFSVGGIITIVVILLVLIGGIAGWFVYAYKNPQTSSGMWLMEHRPSQMKQKMAKMKFWKKNTPTGEKYRVESEA